MFRVLYPHRRLVWLIVIIITIFSVALWCIQLYEIKRDSKIESLNVPVVDEATDSLAKDTIKETTRTDSSEQPQETVELAFEEKKLFTAIN